MNGWTSLDRFLRTDPRDVGCAEAIARLHVYVDLVAAGAPPPERPPGVGTVPRDWDALRACRRSACASTWWPREPAEQRYSGIAPARAARAKDFEGLLAVVRGEEDRPARTTGGPVQGTASFFRNACAREIPA